MIIGHDLVVQLGLKTKFGSQIMEWDDMFVTMKEPGNFLGKSNLTQQDTREVKQNYLPLDKTINELLRY